MYKIFIILCFFVVSINAYAEENKRIIFSESFINDISMDKKEYNKKIDFQIKEYKKITKDEIYKLKNKIRDIWGDTLLTSQNKWVYYSSDLKTRSSVEFETGFILIESLSDIEIIDERFFKYKIFELISMNIESVYKNDPLIISIENRMKEANLNAVYDNDFDEPIIALISTDEFYPNNDILEYKSKEILSNGKILTYKTKKNKIVKYFKGKINTKKMFPYGEINRNAFKYKQYIEKYSKTYNIEDELIYAVIHNESSFNPFATSYIPAYGLMQIVPIYAGRAVSSYIFEREVLLSPSYLYDYSNNIMVGTAYLSLIYHNYLKNIINKKSRLYCTIAAYNTGIGNIARAFNSNKDLRNAIKNINLLSSSQVYQELLKNLPYNETKEYLKKVIKSYEAYRGH